VRGPLEVLEDLLRIESPSGREERVVEYLRELLERAGAKPRVHGRNVWAERGDGPTTLLLNSHIDTVPATSAWTRPPFGAVTEGDKLFGLGSADAKSAVVGQLFAFLDAKLPKDAKLVWTATCDEETGGEGLEVLLPHLPKPDSVIIGEPTEMQPCHAQKGMIKLEVRAPGRAGHASRPWQGDNAIYRAARALLAVEAIPLTEKNAVLGPPTLAVTLISGGTRANVIPPECAFTIDGRTIPELPNDVLIDRVRAAVGDCTVNIKSNRYVPVQTADDARIVRAALAALPGSSIRAFGGVSDFYYVRECPGIVIGPGSPPQSHQADEHIERAAVERGAAGYTRIVEEFFSR
jgi:acetylornithine deacetylase